MLTGYEKHNDSRVVIDISLKINLQQHVVYYTINTDQLQSTKLPTAKIVYINT